MYQHALKEGCFKSFEAKDAKYDKELCDCSNGYVKAFNNTGIISVFGSRLNFARHMPIYHNMPFLIGTNKLDYLPADPVSLIALSFAAALHT